MRGWGFGSNLHFVLFVIFATDWNVPAILISLSSFGKFASALVHWFSFRSHFLGSWDKSKNSKLKFDEVGVYFFSAFLFLRLIRILVYLFAETYTIPSPNTEGIGIFSSLIVAALIL